MKVFIDMDSVLSDFVGGVKKLFKLNAIDWNATTDIVKHVPIPPKAFWKACDYDFWANLDKTPFADELVSFLFDTFDSKDLCVATKPCLTAGCVNGKRDWLQTHYPTLKNHIFGSAKEFLASPDAILIDDFEKNCQKFRDRGGMTCLIRRPWNTTGDFDTMECAKRDILKLGAVCCG